MVNPQIKFLSWIYDGTKASSNPESKDVINHGSIPTEQRTSVINFFRKQEACRGHALLLLNVSNAPQGQPYGQMLVYLRQTAQV